MSCFPGCASFQLDSVHALPHCRVSSGDLAAELMTRRRHCAVLKPRTSSTRIHNALCHHTMLFSREKCAVFFLCLLRFALLAIDYHVSLPYVRLILEPNEPYFFVAYHIPTAPCATPAGVRSLSHYSYSSCASSCSHCFS